MKGKGTVFASVFAAAMIAVSASAGAASMSQKKASLRIGRTLSLDAPGAQDWKSSDERTARVNGNGVVTAKKAGTATIVASLNDGGTARFRIRILPKIVAYPSSASVAVGKKVNLQLKNFSDSKAVWKSSDSEIASVNGSGVVKGKKAGAATITAEAEGEVFSFSVAVRKRSLKTTPKKKTVYVGDKIRIGISGSAKAVKYSSSNPKVVKAASDGLVTALSPGSATIAVSASDGSSGKSVINVARKRKSLRLVPAGNDMQWKRKAELAVRYVRLSPSDYDRVLRYLGVVKQVKTVTSTQKSNMDVFADAPTFTAGPKIYSDAAYFASCIVHDAYHSKLYFDAEATGRDGKAEYEGKAAEIKCCEIQRDFLRRIASAAGDASVRSSASRYASYLQEIISNPDSNQYWVDWETNPY